MRAAAISIAGNIAEGFGRQHTKDKLNYYFFSRASSTEEISHLLCGIKVGYFSEQEVASITDKCRRAVEELNKLIKSLSHRKLSQPQP